MHCGTLLFVLAGAGEPPAPDRAVQAWLAHAPKAPTLEDPTDTSLMQTSASARALDQEAESQELGWHRPNLRANPYSSGSDYGYGSCHGHHSCENLKNHNNNRINQMKDKVNAVPRNNDNDYNAKWAAYRKDRDAKRSTTSTTLQYATNDDQWEWGLAGSTTRAGQTQMRNVMSPVNLKYSNVEDRFKIANESAQKAFNDHNKVVGDKNQDFLTDTQDQEWDAGNKSIDAARNYPYDVDLARWKAGNTTETTLEGVANDIKNEQKLRADWDKGLSEGHEKLEQINKDLALLSTNVQNDQAEHAQKAEAFLDGEGAYFDVDLPGCVGDAANGDPLRDSCEGKTMSSILKLKKDALGHWRVEKNTKPNWFPDPALRPESGDIVLDVKCEAGTPEQTHKEPWTGCGEDESERIANAMNTSTVNRTQPKITTLVMQKKLVSLESMMEDGEAQADNMEEAEEQKIDSFVDGQETDNKAMQAEYATWLDQAGAGAEITQENVEATLENMTRDFDQNVEYLDSNMTRRHEIMKDEAVKAEEIVEGVADKLEEQHDAIKEAQKRTGSVADDMLKTENTRLTAAKKAAEDAITKNDFAVEDIIKDALKNHTRDVEAAKRRIIDSKGADLRAILAENQGFVTPLFLMPKNGSETVKGVESTLAGVRSGLSSDAEKLTTAQKRVHNMIAKSTEIRDLEGKAEKGIGDAKKALSDAKNKYAVDVQKAVLSDNKEVQKTQAIARGSVTAVRDEIGTQISEVAESKLATTESMVAKAGKEATKLKGEIAQANTAMGSREAQFEFNEAELKRLKNETQVKTSVYQGQAGDVKEQAVYLKDDLATGITTELTAKRKDNEEKFGTAQGELRSAIEVAAGNAATELEKVKTAVTTASQAQEKQREKRYEAEEALLANIQARETSNHEVQSEFQSKFGGIRGRVDQAASTMSNILEQTELRLKGQAGNVDQLIQGTQEQFAKQAADAFNQFDQAMANLRTDYAQAGNDAATEADSTMAQNSKDSEGATQQAEDGLQAEADGVGDLDNAANSPVSGDAVGAAEAASNLVNGAAGAASDTALAAEAGLDGVGASTAAQFNAAGSTADDQLASQTNAASQKLDALGSQLSGLFGSADSDAASASDTANSMNGAIGDAVNGEAGALASQQQQEGGQGGQLAEELEGAAQAEGESEGLEASEINAIANEANDEAHRSEGATAQAVGGINAAGAIVDEQVNEVEQEEESRVEKLNPAWRLDKMDKDFEYLKKDLTGQQEMTETEAQNVMEQEEAMTRAAEAEIPNIKSRISLLKPDVLASPKATMDRLEGLRRDMAVVMQEISDRGFEAQSQANSAKLLFDGKEDKMKRTLEKVEGDIAEAMEMAQYQSEEAMNRVAKLMETGLAQDRVLNLEVKDNVQPKTDDYRWRINNVYRALGREIDMDEIMGQANQSMQEEMKLRDRLSGSGEDIEKYIAQTQKLAKAKIDAMYNDMLRKIAAIQHDASLNEYEKAARIAMLKEQAKAGREQLATQVNELAGAQFEEMQKLDDKKYYAQTLAERAAAAARGDPSKVTSRQMQGFFGDLRKKFKELDDHYNQGPDAGPESLLETDAPSPARADVEELADEARNLRVTHDKEERDVSEWMSELNQMGANAI